MAQIAASRLAQGYGAKILVTIASVVCSLLTLITPWAASIDWRFVLATRALQGLFQGFFYPCCHTLLAKWVHVSERGLLTTITYSGTQAGSVIMLGASGILAASPMGWPSIFYFSGIATLLWGILWVFLGADSPATCPRISCEEKKFIESMPGSSHQQLSTPWSKILTSVPVLALVLVHSTQCWGFWTLLTETPSYLKDIFKFDIKTVRSFSFFVCTASQTILLKTIMFFSFHFIFISVFSCCVQRDRHEIRCGDAECIVNVASVPGDVAN